MRKAEVRKAMVRKAVVRKAVARKAVAAGNVIHLDSYFSWDRFKRKLLRGKSMARGWQTTHILPVRRRTPLRTTLRAVEIFCGSEQSRRVRLTITYVTQPQELTITRCPRRWKIEPQHRK